MKVYGSLLVLCRWAAANKTSSAPINGKKHNFWLVVSDGSEASGNRPLDSRAFDNLQDQFMAPSFSEKLSGDLISLLKVLFNEAQVFTTDQLKGKLSP